MKEFQEISVAEIPEEQREIPSVWETGRKPGDPWETSALLDDYFQRAGWTEAAPGEAEKAEALPEQGEDGKYHDRETGKTYDSMEEWRAEQETLAKRYEGTAEYYQKKADKEWAEFKNAEENGASEEEKWAHYRKSQEYYAKAKECREKAQALRSRLAELSSAGEGQVSFAGILGGEKGPTAKLDGMAQEPSFGRGEAVGEIPTVLADGKEAEKKTKPSPGRDGETAPSFEGKTWERSETMELPAFDAPKEYLDALQERYENADPAVREVYDRYASKLKVKTASLSEGNVAGYFHGLFGLGRGISFNAMEDLADPRGAGNQYFHEVGHMIDDMARFGPWYGSQTERFEEALKRDGQNVLALYRQMSDGEKLSFTERLFADECSSVSDLLGGLTRGEIQGKYGHTEEYWQYDGVIPLEAFAHFFEAGMGESRQRERMEGFFPEAKEVFDEIIDRLRAKDGAQE